MILADYWRKVTKIGKIGQNRKVTKRSVTPPPLKSIPVRRAWCISKLILII